MKPPTKYICDTCKSDRVLCDAWAEWDTIKQEWVLSTTFSAAFCKDCDCETSITQVSLTN